ncbi:hypothetical protein ACET7V_19225 [Aeromonas sanarellii]|uniref:hypothetical protein n=1 Tax=Aeromonas sanarellii TaxID=633415 RepID=UPI0038D04366
MKKEFHRKLFLLHLEAEKHLEGFGAILALPVFYITLILKLFGLGTHRKTFPYLYKGRVIKVNYLTERFLPALITTMFFVGVPFFINYFWGVNVWLLFSISVFVLSIIFGFSYLDAEKRAEYYFVDFKIKEAELKMSQLFWWECDPELRKKWLLGDGDSSELSKKREEIMNTIRYWEGQRKL